jgi:cytochrome c-type biogenesis protein
MDWITSAAEHTNMPFWAALALGLLTAVSPCPLATNITATAFISKELKSKTRVVMMGALYTAGRAITYASIGIALYLGANTFDLARFFQANGERILGPLLLITGLVMLGAFNLSGIFRFQVPERFTDKLNKRGGAGALVLGIVFALAFCPYSGAIYFGVLVPMTLKHPSGLYLPLVFALGTGVPVLLFAYLIATSASLVGRFFNAIRKTERVMRILAAGTFLVMGTYYCLVFFYFR